MRIVTFNTHHGLRPGGPVDTAALAAWCASLGADVLALQEVDVRAARSGRADQAAAVARATGMAVRFGAARRMGLVGRYGSALLVRGSIDGAASLALPRVGRREGRAAVLAGVTVGGRRLSVAATHLSVHPDEASAQLAAVLDALAARPAPRLLLGDLNLDPDQLAAALGARPFAVADARAPSFPAHEPRLRIDHVVAEGLALVSAEVLPAGPVSDHRAVAVEADWG